MDTETLLEQTGLTRTEAKVYLCLLNQSPLTAAAVAEQAGTSRSTAYVVLGALMEKGFVDGGIGYSSKYRPVPPQEALTSQLDRDRHRLAERERSVGTALPRLAELFAASAPEPGELVEVVRSPAVVDERLNRLQAQAVETMETMVRGPIEIGGANEAEIAALRRGVRVRALYEHTLIGDPAVVGHLGRWTEAGEEARVHAGDVPMKCAIFDRRVVIMPLTAPDQSGAVAVIVRSAELAAALGLVFDTLWTAAEPLHRVLDRQPSTSRRR